MTLSDLATRISFLGAMICVISALGFLCAALVIRRLHRLEAQLLAMRLSSAPLSVEGDLPYREIEGGRFEALTYDGYRVFESREQLEALLAIGRTGGGQPFALGLRTNASAEPYDRPQPTPCRSAP